MFLVLVIGREEYKFKKERKGGTERKEKVVIRIDGKIKDHSHDVKCL